MHTLSFNIIKAIILTSPYDMDKIIVTTDKVTTCPGVTDQPMCFVIDVVCGGGLRYAIEVLGIPVSIIVQIPT